MASIRVVCVPLSERKAIPRLWTSDAVYVNCFDCGNAVRNGVCIYDMLNDADKRLCPLTAKNGAGAGFQCPICKDKELCVNA